MQTLSSTTVFDLQEIADRVQEVLDDMWRQGMHEPFPEDRMKRLIDITSVHLASAVEKRLAAVNLWDDEFHKVCKRAFPPPSPPPPLPFPTCPLSQGGGVWRASRNENERV